MTLLGKLKEAFPDKINEKVVYTSFKISSKATIYVDHAIPHIAKIRTTCFQNFPNGKLLEEYIKKNNIAAVESKSHPDVLIGIEHIDQVIKIITN
jgi:hypothetical protein